MTEKEKNYQRQELKEAFEKTYYEILHIWKKNKKKKKIYMKSNFKMFNILKIKI